MSVNEKVKVIGLTGMSGAGKSTACNTFKESGFKILDCDLICRDIVEKGSRCLAEITESFGDSVLDGSGCLNRAEMGRIIFTDGTKRLKLNGIMYPYVSYIIIKRILNLDGGFVILDAPTLFESGLETVCDKVVSVIADKDLLLKRIIQRDSLSMELAENRLASQHSAEYYAERSDYIIENNGLHEEFLIDIVRTIKSIKDG